MEGRVKDLGDIEGWYDAYIEARESGRVSAVFREIGRIDADPLRPPVSLAIRMWNTIAQDAELTSIGRRTVDFWKIGLDAYEERYGYERLVEENRIVTKFTDFLAWVKWKSRSRGLGPMNFRELIDIGANDFSWRPVEGDTETAFRKALLETNQFYEE